MVSLHIDGLSNGDADSSRVSSKEKQTLRPGGEAEQGQAAKTILVVTETRNFRTQPFVVPDETNRVGKGWEGWLEGIEREFRYFRITETRKTPQSFYGGTEITRPDKSLPDTEMANFYLKLRAKLNEHIYSEEKLSSCEVFRFEN